MRKAKTFPGTPWTGFRDGAGLKTALNGPNTGHYTARFWMSPEGELFCELPCEGNHTTEYLPPAVWKWLVSP